MSLHGYPMHLSISYFMAVANPAVANPQTPRCHGPTTGMAPALETTGTVSHHHHQGALVVVRMRSSSNRSWIDSRRCLWLQATNNKLDVVLGAHDKRELPRLQRQLPLTVSRLLEPAEFEASKLRVEFMQGAGSGDCLDHTARNASRVYTLTHCDVTAALHLTIGKKVNHRQLRGWYQRLLRDEVIARWHMRSSGDNSLHVHCHVSGAHALMAPAVLRNWIFTREMPVVLQAIRYGDQALLRRQPELCMAPVWVHFQSDSEEFHRADLWGPLFFAASGVGLSDPRKANTCRALVNFDDRQVVAMQDLAGEPSTFMGGAITLGIDEAAETCRGSALAVGACSSSVDLEEEEGKEEVCSSSGEPVVRRKVWIKPDSGGGLSSVRYRDALAEMNGGRVYEHTEERLSHNVCGNVGVLDVASAMDGQFMADVVSRREQRVVVGSSGYDL